MISAIHWHALGRTGGSGLWPRAPWFLAVAVLALWLGACGGSSTTGSGDGGVRGDGAVTPVPDGGWTIADSGQPIVDSAPAGDGPRVDGPRPDGSPAVDGPRDGGGGQDSGGGGQDSGGGGQDGGGGGIWHPAPGTSWQWQLTGTIDTSVNAQMYDIDLFDNDVGVITTLHNAGRIVICYFSAGSGEDWRPDYGDIPSGALGNDLEGWAGEKWLDVRNAGVRSVMTARLDLAASKNCDGVEPDNVDGYSNNSGFPLTAANQLDYLRFLATQAHSRGLSIGLKNDLEQVQDLVADFDWAINEECFQYDECDLLTPFIDAGKAVFQCEYGDQSTADSVCPDAEALGFSTIIKQLDLDAWRIACN